MLAFLAANLSFADTLELSDGTILEGDFVGSSNGIIMFQTGADLEAYPEDKVVAVYLSSGVETAMAANENKDLSQVTIPAGTRLIIRMTDTVDSSRHGTGHRFRGQLEGALVVDGVSVIPRNSIVHGRIANAKQGGRVAGSSELSMEFTDIMIDDQLFPIATGNLSAQTKNEAGRTIGRTARAAAIGGLIDGSKGARTGAKVGAGASLLTRGGQINIPRGTILETTLSTPLTVPRK